MKTPKIGRLERFRRAIRRTPTQPRALLGIGRKRLVNLWASRGAGWFGLGWLCTFLILQVQLFAGDVLESEGISDFFAGQILELLFRIGWMSVLNSFLALLWPFYVLERLETFGILILVVSYFAFELLLRPLIETHVPQLKRRRDAAVRLKKMKQSRRQK